MEASKVGVVYVLQMEGHPYYKIGRTVNLNNRVSQISPQMPGKLKVVFAHKVADCFFWEHQLHGDYRHKRLNGEWFSLDSADLELIEARLLASQAEKFFCFIIDKFQKEVDAVSLRRVEQYGRLIALSARKADRRINRMWDLYLFGPPAYTEPGPEIFEGVIG